MDLRMHKSTPSTFTQRKNQSTKASSLLCNTESQQDLGRLLIKSLISLGSYRNHGEPWSIGVFDLVKKNNPRSAGIKFWIIQGSVTVHPGTNNKRPCDPYCLSCKAFLRLD